MKKEKNILYIVLPLIAVFIGVSIFTFHQSSQSITDGYLASEGNAARNFAVLTASNIHLTDEQVETLKNYSYAELQASEENNALKAMMDNDHFASKVDYAYVMIHLNKDEVKYQVSEETKDKFDAPIGTDLDIMWLLDVTLNDKLASSTDDLERYSYFIEADTAILSPESTYIYNASEWGNHICGYAPLYSVSGKYIGAVGVELQTGDYDAYRARGMMSMGILFFVSTLTLTVLFLILYFKYKRLQYEKIYTDPLTHISNRSYYNDQFIKHLSTHQTSGYYFALMIADIDWFKKVNDTFGHEIGDEVLIEISSILLELFGKKHVVRYGGEEFVIGLWIKDEQELKNKIEQLFQKITEQQFSKRQIDISISLGCSYSKEERLNGWLLSGMLKTADDKLYEAKENGRKQYRMEEYSHTETCAPN